MRCRNVNRQAQQLVDIMVEIKRSRLPRHSFACFHAVFLDLGTVHKPVRVVLGIPRGNWYVEGVARLNRGTSLVAYTTPQAHGHGRCRRRASVQSSVAVRQMDPDHLVRAELQGLRLAGLKSDRTFHNKSTPKTDS